MNDERLRSYHLGEAYGLYMALASTHPDTPSIGMEDGDARTALREIHDFPKHPITSLNKLFHRSKPDTRYYALHKVLADKIRKGSEWTDEPLVTKGYLAGIRDVNNRMQAFEQHVPDRQSAASLLTRAMMDKYVTNKFNKAYIYEQDADNRAAYWKAVKKAI
ncbi:hypothetical protein [Lacticaseibacillus zhaodongensis]|uniref:hypothetical protein n=1 Tax=Lacticaseibacillus zhaodongensis TaxID=2668065 RepID=UPI0012D36F9F|nr:hypothetical protein [Lacticaseibacillus zhaodongensis]